MSSTMPDTLSREEIEAIRKRVKEASDPDWQAYRDRRLMLAHIDALTAAVEGLDAYDGRYTHDGDALIPQSAVLAILRGDES